jgi:hypothetical protein
MSKKLSILWRIVTLLSGDSITTAVSGQRLGKHVPMATNMHATIALLLETGSFLCGPCQDIITGTDGAMSSVSSISQRATAEPQKLKYFRYRELLQSND